MTTSELSKKIALLSNDMPINYYISSVEKLLNKYKSTLFCDKEQKKIDSNPKYKIFMQKYNIYIKIKNYKCEKADYLCTGYMNYQIGNYKFYINFSGEYGDCEYFLEDEISVIELVEEIIKKNNLINISTDNFLLDLKDIIDRLEFI